jgi:DNA invertase Pin-like site-specific DNA recombinase
MKLGYARVSTVGQSLEVQLDKLSAAGCEKVYQEKKSGKSRDGRDELKRLLDDVLREGDCLVCTKLDRLARSVLDLCQIAKQIEAKGASLCILDESIDTSTNGGRLYFHMLAAIGEFERSLILARTEEGRQKALASGVKFGRKEKLNDFQKAKLRQDFASWTGSKEELAGHYGISVPTLYRLAKAPEDANTTPPD